MPKKNKKPAQDATWFKEQGNAAFLNKDFKKALEHYNQAIEMAKEDPKDLHVFLSNKANAQLELMLWEEALASATEAL